jgi:hypothetical protein
LRARFLKPRSSNNTLNAELKKLALDLKLDAPENFYLRLAFGMACIKRVEHFITSSDLLACMASGDAYVAKRCSKENLQIEATKAAALAQSHAGTGGLDGSGNAAVSASFGLARALAGAALDAAGYAAYAAVYSYASYAVTDPAAFADEHAWQVASLRALHKSMSEEL